MTTKEVSWKKRKILEEEMERIKNLKPSNKKWLKDNLNKVLKKGWRKANSLIIKE